MEKSEAINFDDFVDNLQILQKNPKALERAMKAVREVNVKEFNNILREFRLRCRCVILCRWICFVVNWPWYRYLEVNVPEYKLEELIDVTIKLHKHPDFGEALMKAHKSNEIKPIEDVIRKLDADRYRPYLLRWCHYLKCIIVCRWFCYYPYFF